jgi:LPXTG-motif cell wall-anchored protein
MRLVVKCVALAVVSTVALAGPSSAQTGYGSTTEVRPGQVVEVRGVACSAGSTVTVTFDGDSIGSSTAASDGSWTVNAVVPSNASAGSHTVQGVCDNRVVHVATFVVVRGGGGALARTGSDVGALVGAGVALVLLGSAFVVGKRRLVVADAAAVE